MSKVRQTATMIVTRSEATRGNWSPNPDSAHYRVYGWWARRARKRPARENFCHYWRVVLIWAPLHWLATPAMLLVTLGFLAMLVVLGLRHLEPLQLALLVVGGIYVGVGAAATKQLLHDELRHDLAPRRVDWLSRRSSTFRRATALLTLPVVVTLSALTAVVFLLVSTLTALEDDYRVWSRLWRWLVSQPINVKGLRWLRPLEALIIVLIGLGLALPSTRSGVLQLLMAVTLCLMLFGLVFLASYLRELAQERRRRRKQRAVIEQREPLLRWLFAYWHPDRAGSDFWYNQWRVRFIAYTESRSYGLVPFYDTPEDQLTVWVNPAHLPRASTPSAAVQSIPARPSRLRRIWRPIDDYLALIWAVAVNLKRKTCPLVSLPR